MIIANINLDCLWNQHNNKINFFCLRKDGGNTTVHSKLLLFLIFEGIFIFSSANVVRVTDSIFKVAHWIRKYIMLAKSRTTPVFFHIVWFAHYLWSRVVQSNHRNLLSNMEFRLKHFYFILIKECSWFGSSISLLTCQ